MSKLQKIIYRDRYDDKAVIFYKCSVCGCIVHKDNWSGDTHIRCDGVEIGLGKSKPKKVSRRIIDGQN